jgi:hypothetical protein
LRSCSVEVPPIHEDLLEHDAADLDHGDRLAAAARDIFMAATAATGRGQLGRKDLCIRLVLGRGLAPSLARTRVKGSTEHSAIQVSSRLRLTCNPRDRMPVATVAVEAASSAALHGRETLGRAVASTSSAAWCTSGTPASSIAPSPRDRSGRSGRSLGDGAGWLRGADGESGRAGPCDSK